MQVPLALDPLVPDRRLGLVEEPEARVQQVPVDLLAGQAEEVARLWDRLADTLSHGGLNADLL